MSTELSAHDRAILNCVFNPNLPLEEAILEPHQELKDEEECDTKFEQVKQLEIKAITLSENGGLKEALQLLNKAIQILPEKPSLYNNRAHVYQYMRKFNEAFNDLTEAINLCSDKHKKTLSLAHCQRGLLHRRAERINEAREDFEIAAKMGNVFAKAQLVQVNPYAALCNQMIEQVMDTLK